MKKQGLFPPLLLATTLAVGFGAVWGVVGLWAQQVGAHVAGCEGCSESLGFLRDGTPRIYANGTEERDYFDLERRPVPPPEDGESRMQWGTPLPAAMPIRTAKGDVDWEQRIRAFSDGDAPAVYWYFQSDGRPDGTGYFVGYDSRNSARVGFLGLAGFRSGPLPGDELIPFGGNQTGPQARVFNAGSYGGASYPRRPWQAAPGSLSPWNIYVFGRDAKLYHVDLRRRTVRAVLEGSEIRSVALGSDNHDPARIVPIIRTEDAVLVLGEDDQVEDRFAIPESLRDRGLTFVATSIGEAVMYWHSPKDSMATALDYEIYWVAPDGSSRQTRISLPWVGGATNQAVVVGAVAPSPAFVLGLVPFFRTAELLENATAATYGQALSQALADYAPALAIAQLVALALAGLCYRRQVRYGAGGAERLAWPIFVVILGLPGWIGYRFGRAWPVLERCPSCSAVVPRNCPECVRCAAEFPGPALKGTEVFA
jgi:hypothetical protein